MLNFQILILLFNLFSNYPPITLPPLQTPVEIEEHRKNTTFDQNYNSLHYRQSSAQNIKINEIANDLESGKIEDQINLSNVITMAINNANAFEIKRKIKINY